MAKRSTLFIRIVEGKNLPIKDITGSSDPYCIVRIDSEAIIRTATIWKTLSPFWGEEYHVDLPPTFHAVSFYVLDEDSLSRDDVIGKLSITKEALAVKPQGLDGWLNLTEIDPDEEVQGEIHLHISVVGDGDVPTRLRCQVMEARDLAKKDRNGASDPFVRVRYNGKTYESTVVKKSCYPRWNESFEFELEEDSTVDSPLSVEVWDWDLVSRNDFLGKVLFNINRLQCAQQEEGWFRLGPDKPKHSQHEGTLGSLRLQLRLRDETVLPSSHYQPLTELLGQSVGSHVNGNWPDLIMLIDETTTAESRQEVANNLVKLFLGQGLVKEFLDVLFKLELDKTTEPNTLFRSNSLASKSMESFLKVAGMQYLHRLLGPTINRIFEEKKYVELDPNRVELRCTGLHRTHTEAEVIQQSLTHLQSYLCELLNAILQSAEYCPLVLCQVLQQLYHSVQARFPNPEHIKVKFIAVTSFLCLRFISPAIMSPKLFHLREKHADARTSRTLLLLAKAIQMIANLDTLACCSKEPWMNPLQPTIQQGIAQLKDFIAKLVSCQETPYDDLGLGLQTRMSLQCGSMEKEGYLLLHCTKDKCMPMTSPFKKYFVTLSRDTLSYARTQHSKKSSFILLPKIKAVEKVEEKSFGSANVMQLISSDDSGQLETLYLDCKSVNELNHWLSALRKACSHNTDTMSSYHPGIYKADRWSCCHQKDKTDPGCDKTKHGVTLQEWYDPLDPDLESQLIYRHLLGVQELMKQKYEELQKIQGNEEEDVERDEKKDDAVTRLFQVLEGLHHAHIAVEEEEEERTRNKNNFLLELQT